MGILGICAPQDKGKWDTYGSVNHTKVIIVPKKDLEACDLSGKEFVV